jgi:outer membrane lipopolysaccharide assembly protein LptE/RlpB
MWWSRTRVAVLALAVAPLVSGCGYSLAGRGSFLPANIRTIGVPLFTNATPVFNVEQTITEKVRSELIGRGKYKVLPDTVGVDAILRGQISSIVLAPASFTGTQQAARYILTLTANIEFVDAATGKVIWSDPAMAFREEYDATNTTALVDVSTFFGQEASALERVSAEFAKAVISSILEAF